MLTRALPLLALFALAGCGPSIVHSPDATPDPIDGRKCDAAGARLAALKCPEAFTPKGTPYAYVCLNAAIGGVDLFTCPLAAADCDAVKECR